MNLIRAEAKAKYLLKELEEFCDRIEIVGNIRRRKQDIDKIDILLSPKGVRLFDLMAKIVGLGSDNGMKVASKKVVVVKDELGDIKADLWFTSIDNWPIMLLVKTGGNRTNQRISTLLAGKDLRLSTSEGMIYNKYGKRLLLQKEEDIFNLLEIPYIEPSERE